MTIQKSLSRLQPLPSLRMRFIEERNEAIHGLNAWRANQEIDNENVFMHFDVTLPHLLDQHSDDVTAVAQPCVPDAVGSRLVTETGVARVMLAPARGIADETPFRLLLEFRGHIT